MSGISASVAKRIVTYREQKGKITERSELQNIAGLGPKAYEQCAGFLKIPESAEPLDNTWVHPENYEAARAVFELVKQKSDISSSFKESLKEKYGIGEQTVNDIIDELKKPNRDPRDEYPKPIMQKGVVAFEDLKEGMKVTGKIKNVVDFGAFVDLGLKETALLHISELSDSYVADPMDVVKVGDVKECTVIALDPVRRRISLSLKSERSARPLAGALSANGGVKTASEQAHSHTHKAAIRVVQRKDADGYDGHNRSKTGQRYDASGDAKNKAFSRTDDGMSYNPFAELLKKR